MKKILLCCVVVVLTMIICVLPSFATSVSFDVAEGAIVEGTASLANYDPYTPVYTYHFSEDVIMVAGEFDNLADCYLETYFDGLEYAYKFMGYDGETLEIAYEATVYGGVVDCEIGDGNIEQARAVLSDILQTDVTVVETPSYSPIESVLSAFGFVFSWLPASVVTLIGIFWTGSALTPIGVLSVAGLSIGVILLIFSIISRFLKFRG